MAEGPTIVLLKERASRFVGRKVTRARGNAPMAMDRVVGRRVTGLRTHGKQFFIELGDFAVRVHLLMLGSYCINERKDKPVRLSLVFTGGDEINFYSCSAKLVDEPLETLCDWRTDVMADTWDPAFARKQLRAMPKAYVCDALLDQTVFAGVGNIIKNEVLFRIRVHPLSRVGALPPAKLRALVEQARIYTLEFYAWKRANTAGTGRVWRGDTLKAHWLVHTKKVCPRCEIPLVKAHLGELERRSFYCERCQRRYRAL